jgi:hypothetical protein
MDECHAVAGVEVSGNWGEEIKWRGSVLGSGFGGGKYWSL